MRDEKSDALFDAYSLKDIKSVLDGDMNKKDI